MRLVYKSQVIKQLKKLPLSEKKKVVRKLEALNDDPQAGKALKGELKGLYSVRAWPYRIIYSINKSIITIFSISHRQSGYH
jgi:mRNA-degrading endonuclease RelE of RelBE toxin-antitoxin system